MMKRVGILYRQGDGVVLILKFGVEVLPLHSKFPCLPGTTTIRLIHSLIEGMCGLDSERENVKAGCSHRRASWDLVPRLSVSAGFRFSFVFTMLVSV